MDLKKILILLFIPLFMGFSQTTEQKQIYKQLTGKDLDLSNMGINLSKNFDTHESEQNELQFDTLVYDSTNFVPLNQVDSLFKLKRDSAAFYRNILRDSLFRNYQYQTPANSFFERYVNQEVIDPYTTKLKRYNLHLKNVHINTNYYKKIPETYKIKVGDEILVDVWGAINKNHVLEVGQGGFIVIPDIGRFDLEALTYREAKEVISKKLKSIVGLEFAIRLGKLSPVRVKVYGSIGKPGLYNIQPYTNLLEIIAIAGGITDSGSLRNIVYYHENKKKIIDLYDLFFFGKDYDLSFSTNDKLFIPLVGNQVAIAGNVKREGIFEIKEKEKLSNFLKIVGLNSISNSKNIEIERISSSGKRQQLTTQSKDNFILQDGDIIRVFSNLAFDKNFVFLKGNFRYNKEIAFKHGLTISDIFADSTIIKKNTYLEEGHILRSSAFEKGLKIIKFSPQKALYRRDHQALHSGDTIIVYSASEAYNLPHICLKGAIKNPGSYKYIKNITVNNLVLQAGGITFSGDLKNVTVTRFSNTNGLRYYSHVNPDTFQLNPADTVYIADYYEKNPKEKVGIFGAVKHGGNFEYGEGVTVNNLLSLAGGLQAEALDSEVEILRGINKSNDKIYLERYDLKTALGIKLRPNDFVNIKTNLDYSRSISVQIKGEVSSPGKYIVNGNTTLKDILERCGGLTPLANPKGIQYFRESVRKLQNESIAKLQKQLFEQLQKISIAENRHEVLKSMRFKALAKVYMKGRVVIDYEKIISGKRELLLRNNDIIFIPPKSSEITVLGEVMNQTAINYDPENRDVEYYLDKAGSLNSFANEDKIYIYKANGEIVRDDSWCFNIMSYELEPGDMICVPFDFEQIFVTRNLKTLKEITSILYQLSASSLNTYMIYDKVNE